jgi:AbrB family looped-hinge helix DNA binding protein
MDGRPLSTFIGCPVEATAHDGLAAFVRGELVETAVRNPTPRKRTCLEQTGIVACRHAPSLITVVICDGMLLARSRLTAQGQISVPAEIRRRLGVGPGSVLEWDETEGEIVVRRAGRFTSQDVHRRLFRNVPRSRTLGELKVGVRTYVKRRHARR